MHALPLHHTQKTKLSRIFAHFVLAAVGKMLAATF